MRADRAGRRRPGAGSSRRGPRWPAVLPSGLTARQRSGGPSPLSVVGRGRPVATSQIRIVRRRRRRPREGLAVRAEGDLADDADGDGPRANGRLAGVASQSLIVPSQLDGGEDLAVGGERTRSMIRAGCAPRGCGWPGRWPASQMVTSRSRSRPRPGGCRPGGRRRPGPTLAAARVRIDRPVAASQSLIVWS